MKFDNTDINDRYVVNQEPLFCVIYHYSFIVNLIRPSLIENIKKYEI